MAAEKWRGGMTCSIPYRDRAAADLAPPAMKWRGSVDLAHPHGDGTKAYIPFGSDGKRGAKISSVDFI